MLAHKIQLKLPFAQPLACPLEAFVPVLHEWIRSDRLGELLIDVVDYLHVHQGPGVLLVGHASDYFIDTGEGVSGLVVSCKREPPPPDQRLADAFRRALRAASLLESEASLGEARFDLSKIELRIVDRLLAPNVEDTFSELRPELAGFVADWLGESGANLRYAQGDPRQLFGVAVELSRPATASQLLERLPS